jgi:hypothetical protein
MDLYLTNNGSPQNLYASIWDYEFRKWVRIPLTGEHTSIQEANRYVGPGGEIKLKVDSNQSMVVDVTGSNISLVVEP